MADTFLKGYAMRVLGSLIALTVLSASLQAAPKYPFPQNAAYKYGIKPAVIDAKRVQTAYLSFAALYKEEGDLGRISFDDPGLTVSEGIGYGMLVFAYMDNATNNTQSKFDKLWRYYNKFLDTKGLMNWRISGFSSVTGSGAATDAELDVAVALLQAYKQWGDEKYLTDAKALIAKIAEHEVNTNGFLKPGDSWDSEKNPSYFSTAALELFKKASDYNWDNVKKKSYELLKKSQNSTTGLVPNWCNEQGVASGGDRGYYTYDATRTPWRIGWAYSWYGDVDAKDICTKMASWISTKTNNEPSAVVDGYKLDGSQEGEWNNPTFVGPFVCAGMVDAKHQAWVDAGYSFLDKLGADSYYQLSMKILTMLYLSGNMQNLWDYTPIAVAQPYNSESSAAQKSAISVVPGNVPSVRLTLDKPGRVSVSLYSVSGKHVASIAQGLYASGIHTVPIDRALAAGSYLVKMESAGYVMTQRLVVAR